MTKWYAFAGAVLGVVSWATVAIASDQAAADAAAAAPAATQEEAVAADAAAPAADAAVAEEGAVPAADAAVAEEGAAPMEEAAVEPAAPAVEEHAAPAATVNNPAEGWNTLWHHVLIDLYVIGGIFALITIAFMVTYTRKRDDQEGDLPPMNLVLSLTWALIPAFIFMADDFYLAANGWKLWIDQRNVPEGALEIKGLAYMYEWEFEFENGAVLSGNESRENPILLPVGAPIVIRSHSDDVVHSLMFPDFRIKEDVMPGRTTFIWFMDSAPGDHLFTCTEYCGVGHSNMWGRVKTVPATEFEAWIAEKA
ncbi:MAG: cytochrome c oxidase subunit II [Nitrospinae bacterium]|nr:cytochrome c oxidase subunit II [Nitrospinota bacterium]